MAQLIDTCWENGVWADTVWAAGVWGGVNPPDPEPEPESESPSNAGGRIVAGTFTRKKWRALADAKLAQQEAEAQARRLKARGKKALQDAADRAQEAIDAANKAEADAEVNRAVERMADALEVARNATVLAQVIREANRIEITAQAVMQAIQQQRAAAAREAEMKALMAKMAQDELDEEEAVVSLLLL